MTNMPSSQTNIHLYNCADETVQNAIINTYPNFFTTDPDKLLDMVEVLVTQKSNPIVHHLAFASMSQNVRHAEAFESALRHQNSMASTSDAGSARLSEYEAYYEQPHPIKKSRSSSRRYYTHVSGLAPRGIHRPRKNN